MLKDTLFILSFNLSAKHAPGIDKKKKPKHPPAKHALGIDEKKEVETPSGKACTGYR